MTFKPFTESGIQKELRKESRNRYETTMHVITANIPQDFLVMIDLLVLNKLCPSRSEYVRWAVKRALEIDERFYFNNNNYINEELKKHDLVRVPIDLKASPTQVVKSYKTFKIVRRLE